jgi:hypothetical protein
MRRFLLLLALSLALAACKPNPAETQDSSVVRFAGAGFSLEPGPGWIRINTRKLNQGLPQVICQPALTTKGGTIQVVQLGDRIAEKDAIGQILKAMEADELAMKETLTQRDFQADSGTRGKLFRYTRHTAPDPARILNHLTQYVVRTAGGRWISIGALTDSVEQADEVEAMVKRTLREVPPTTPTPRPK